MDWDNFLARFCLAELKVCSSSSLPIGSDIYTHTIVTDLYWQDKIPVYLVRTSAFVCCGELIEGFCVKTGVFFGVCNRIQNETQAFLERGNSRLNSAHLCISFSSTHLKTHVTLIT